MAKPHYGFAQELTIKVLTTIFALAALSLRADAATIKSIRDMSDPVNVKILLGVEGDIAWNAFTLNAPPRLVVDFTDAVSPAVPFEGEPMDEMLLGLRAAQKESAVRLVLDLLYLAPYTVKKTELGDVEIYVRRKVPEEREKTALAPGVAYERVVESRPTGPLTYHVVEVDPRQGWGVTVAGAEGGFGKLEALSGIVGCGVAGGALLGVNGGYFDMKSGSPIGLLIVGGEVLSLDDRYRAFFGVDRSGRPVFMTPRVEVSVACEGGARLFVHRLNSVPKAGERAVFTPVYAGKRTTDGEARTEYVVRGGVVVETQSTAQPTTRPAGGAIPPDGFTLSAPAGDLFCGGGVIAVGAPLKKLITSYPEIREVRAGFSAGPLLVEDGMRKTSLIEDFTVSSGIVSERNPRTAVGVTGDGRLIFIVVEGRSVWSTGLFLDEVADLLVARGAKTGMNLDGGGSSELFAGGKPLNRLSDGKERLLSNAILVFKKQ